MPKKVPIKKVAVIGARGFLGEHVVQQLAASEYEVLAVARSGPSADAGTERSGGQVSEIRGDGSDVEFLRGVLDQSDAAMFCAGRTWQPGLAIREYERQNVALTQAFFTALGRRPDFPVVFTSSLSTIGGSKAPQVYSENSGRDGIAENRLSPYDRAKIACEQIALESAAQGNHVVVLNPGLLLGPGVTPASNLAAPFCLLWYLQGQFAARFYVNGGVTLSDVRDVAVAHVAALDHGTAGQRYILGGHNLDRREFYWRASALAGLRMPIALPAGALHALSSLGDGAAFLSRGLLPSPVHRSFAYTQRLYYFGASDKAIAELGYQIRPMEQTIFDMMRYYHDRKLLPPSLALPPDATLESLPTRVLFAQLARRSVYWRFHRQRLPELYRACQANHALRDALDRLLAISQFDPRSGRYVWPAGSAKDDVQTLQKFFEYVYFASDDFLGKVL